MKGLITAKEARKILGVTDDKFQYMVRSRQINKVMLPGRKYGMYSEAEVNRLSAAINATIEQYVKNTSVFEKATKADLPEIYDLCAKNMPRVSPLETLIAWYNRNPEAFYTLRDNGIVVAYACIFPVNYNWLERVLKDEIRMGDVPLEEIYPFTPDRPTNVYIRDLIVDKHKDIQTRKHYAQHLLFGLIDVLNNMGRRGINIKVFYAMATTPEGNNICKGLHFRAMTELENPTPGYMPYELITDKSDSILVKEYRKQYQQYLRLKQNIEKE
jgi:hypothetical protein